MAIWMHTFILALPLTLMVLSEAATPLFLQAITSALATIPFTGGPMTTGLVGAKLGIGAKLLYYLGFFGQRSRLTRSKAKSSAKSTASHNLVSPAGGSQSFSSFQPVPLPYMFSGGRGFPGIGSNFQQAPQSQQFSGVDPAQLFQILTAQGVDPNTVMEAINYAGASGASAGFGASGGSTGFGANEFERNTGFRPVSKAGLGANGLSTGFGPGGGNPDFGTGGDRNMNTGFGMNSGFSQTGPIGMSQQDDILPDKVSEKGSEDVESFFTFMQDMDENTCISRLICDIGNDPSFLGDFSENIHSMVDSLEVEPSSRAYQYIEVMEMGRKSGNCNEKFPECSGMSYEIVKNVAPSVSLPQNINAINNL